MILVMQSCVDTENEHLRMINKIDGIDALRESYHFEVLDNGRLDTLLEVKTKFSGDNKVFSEINEYQDHIIQKKYYSPTGDCFYSIVLNSGVMFSKFEAWYLAGRILKAQMVSYEGKKHNDTIFMHFEYDTTASGIAFLTVWQKSPKKIMSKVQYNAAGKEDAILQFLDGDTISIENRWYKNNQLDSVRVVDVKHQLKTMSRYSNGEMVKKTIYTNDSLKAIYTYRTDNSGNVYQIKIK